MSDKEYSFKNGNFSFSVKENGEITSLFITDKNGVSLNAVKSGPGLVFETDEGIVDFSDWQIRHEDDGFTLHSVNPTYEVWTRYSLTSTGVFSIRCKIFCSKDESLKFSNCLGLNIQDECEASYKLERPFGQKRGYTRFCHLKFKEKGLVICGYTDLPSFKESNLNIETSTDPGIELGAGQIFESSTSYLFSFL